MTRLQEVLKHSSGLPVAVQKQKQKEVLAKNQDKKDNKEKQKFAVPMSQRKNNGNK